jgi:hypothetical protein
MLVSRSRKEEVCRQAAITDSTFYRWKAKYDGLDAGELKRLKQLEDENRRLKQIVAELMLDNTAWSVRCGSSPHHARGGAN